MAMAASSGAIIAAPARAETEAARHFDIPDGSLGAAIARLGRQAGIMITADPDLVRGRRTSGLRGRYTPEQALRALLRETGLEARPDGRSGYVLRALPKLSNRPAQTEPRPEIVSPVVRDSAEADITVIGTPASRYYADQAPGVLGIGTPSLNTPRATTVIPEQTLLDQQITQLDEGLRNASSVSRGQGFGATYDDLFLRGFRAQVIYRDGRRITFNQRNPTTQIDRIEVLKGPASVLFSAIEPGGVVNIVTKKPLGEPRHFLNASFDSFGKRYVLGDFTGPVTADGQLLYRIAASYENSDTFRDFNRVKRTIISPSLAWSPTENDTIRLSYNYDDESLPIDRGAIVGFFANGDRRIVRTPTSRNVGEPWEVNKMVGHTADIQYSHRFNDDWTVNGGYTFASNRASDLQARAWDYFPEDRTVRGRFVPAGTLIRNVAGNSRFDVTSGQVNLRLTGHFKIAGMDNSLQAGFDGANFRTRRATVAGYNETANIAGGLPLFNLFAPVYGNLQPTNLDLATTNDQKDHYRGVYLQDVLQPAEGLVLTAGIRRDWYRVISTGQSYSEGAVVRSESGNKLWAGWSYQLGISYEFMKGLAVFGDRATSLNINPFFNDDPRSKPQRGTQWEAGLKGDLFNSRLQFTLSWFNITQTNIPTNNPFYDGTNERFLFIGAARSRGVDLDLTARLAEGFNVIANVSAFKYQITDDPDPKLVGKRNANVAPRSANLWASYEFHKGPLSGLGLGSGITYASSRWGDDSNTYKLPAYTLWDAGLWYYVPVFGGSSLRLQASVKNITGKRWYIASDGDAFTPSVIVGQPRTALFAATLQF